MGGGREKLLFYNLLTYYVLICFRRTDISFCHANKALTIQIELGGSKGGREGVSERERISSPLCYQSEIIDSGYIGRSRSRVEMQRDREVVHSLAKELNRKKNHNANKSPGYIFGASW